MKSSFTLNKQERLKSRKLIELLFKEGKSINVFPYLVKYLVVNPADIKSGVPLQAGVTVSKKYFKKAVTRNRIKRLTREAYRLSKPVLKQKLTASGKQMALFFIFTGKDLPEFSFIKEKVQLILNKLIQIIDEIDPENI